jgi:hypothetical protein
MSKHKASPFWLIPEAKIKVTKIKIVSTNHCNLILYGKEKVFFNRKQIFFTFLLKKITNKR